MGISIDWEFLAKVAAGMGDTTAGMLVADYQRKKKEQEDIRAEKRAHQYRTIEFATEQAQRTGDELYIRKQMLDLQTKTEQDVKNYQTKLSTFFDSPEFMGQITSGLTSKDPFAYTQSVGLMTAINKLRANEKLTPQEEINLGKIEDPMVQSGIAGIRKEQMTLNAQLASSAAYASYMNSMSLELKTRDKTQFTDNDILALDKAIAGNEATIQNLMSNETFRSISQHKEQILKQNPNIDPAQLDQLLRQELGETDYSIYQNGLMNMQNLHEANKMLGQRKSMMAQSIGLGQPMMAGAMPGAGVPGMAEPSEVRKQPSGAKKAVASVIEHFKSTGKPERRKDQGLREKYNLPTDAKIYHVKNVESLNKLKKQPDAENAYVYFDGELFRLERRKKVLGLVKVEKK